MGKTTLNIIMIANVLFDKEPKRVAMRSNNCVVHLSYNTETKTIDQSDPAMAEQDEREEREKLRSEGQRARKKQKNNEIS
jgi:hypothetical protein